MTGQERDAAKRTPVMRWLRLYHEARTDAKLESLPDDEFRVWFRLLCFANEQPERGIIARCSPRLLAVQVAHGDIALLQRTLANLTELQIVAASDDAYQFIHWGQRQFASDNVSERVMKHREESRQANETLQKHRGNVAVTAPDVDAEEDAEPEGESQPPPSVIGEDRQQRQQRAHTHEEPPPADANPADDAPQADVAAPGDPNASMRASPALRQERLPDEEFLRQFADAADLPAAARGQALDAIIAEYRPRAPDGVLIVEAYSFREYYPKRPRSNRLLANWMATWWTRRQATIAAAATAQQQREEAQSGQRQHQQQSAAVASARFSGARRRFDPPDPTRNGAYAHRIRDSSDFPDEDG